MNIRKQYRVVSLLLSVVLLVGLMQPAWAAEEDEEAKVTVSMTEASAEELGSLLDFSRQYIVAKQRQLGGSHYAYTEGLSDEQGSPDGNETNYYPGSQLTLLTLEEKDGKVQKTEEVLLESMAGVIRDPDVSPDGTRVLFSWKKYGLQGDDFHLYEMDLRTREITQLTFGQGQADFEGKYLPNGKIIFSSSRIIQTVDCFMTPVSNMYICNADGSNPYRVGYDQVHTTYPTVTSDGRVIYTRWDYNDRTQMYIQGVFQMQPDGTNQTEVFGNDSCFPTTLLHTREIPGEPSKYISIASGHHTLQAGKLVILDTSVGRNDPDAVSFPFPDSQSNKLDHVDGYGQSGPLYKYPVAINDHEFLVSYSRTGWDAASQRDTPFSICYMNAQTGVIEPLSEATEVLDAVVGASQIVPVKTRTLTERPSSVNQAVDTGVFYLGNVYEGEGMEGVAPGEAKYLRVVALEFRNSAIGANQGRGTGTSDPYTPVSTGNASWDVKQVLGIIPLEADGSALFEVPANTPVYFQVLNADGEMIQSMRSWSTLMPNETFSCVGCHEDKNTVPPVQSGVTDAMKKGVQKLQPDLWMDADAENYDPAQAEGFSYLKEVQPILDQSCIECHNDQALSFEAIGADPSGQKIDTTREQIPLVESGAEGWTYTVENNPLPIGWQDPDFDDSAWETGKAPFGTPDTPPGGSETTWSGNNRLYIRKTFTVEDLDALQGAAYFMNIAYDESPIVYLNGEVIFSADGYITEYRTENITAAVKKNLREGENLLAVSVQNTYGGQFIDIGLYLQEPVVSSTGAQFSLEGVTVPGQREKMDYVLSYLVLTGSQNTGVQYLGNPENQYIHWISSMSDCAIMEPYQTGSTQSPLIQRLKDGHGGLSEKEIQTIAAWIDLAAPFRGSYTESNRWGANEWREYTEKSNKRAFYEMEDAMSRRDMLGLTDPRELTITYLDDFGLEDETVTGKGLVRMNREQPFYLGETIRVTLPEGEHYFFFNMDSRLEEALIYCPDGVFEYKISAETQNTWPITANTDSLRQYQHPVITARLATEEELKTERNLALNPYDLTNPSANAASYPHASASNCYNNGVQSEFAARNAIDGYRVNGGHGTYPVQSWGPDQNQENLWFTVDFGHEVNLNRIVLTIRADFPHDVNFPSAVLEFSDGTTQEITIECTAEPQEFQIEGGKVTTSITFKDMKTDSTGWAAFTEVEAFGVPVLG
ncbi:MAG TPA: hypothetical protein H9671_04035 [Firmicutes bacterium]|nr:hypothetical protein [Bacillota bacterium]